MSTVLGGLEQRWGTWYRPVLGILALLVGIVLLAWVLLEGLFAVL